MDREYEASTAKSEVGMMNTLKQTPRKNHDLSNATAATDSNEYVFSDNERAIHARHSEITQGRQFVPRNTLDFVSRPPHRKERGKVLAVEIENCFICRPRALRCRTSGMDTIKVNMTSTQVDSSFAITKAVCESQRSLFKSGDSVLSQGSQVTESRTAAPDVLESTMGRLLRQATPPAPHPPITKEDDVADD